MKNYLRNKDDKVRICTMNIAKMNLLEWMYYRRKTIYKQLILVFNQFIEAFKLIIAIPINLLSIFLYPILGVIAIIQAKKDMKKYNKGANNENKKK